MKQFKRWNRCAASTLPATSGIASRLRTSDRVKSQCGTFREKVDNIVVDLNPVMDCRKTSSLAENEGRGACSSKPLTRGKTIVPTVDKSLEIMSPRTKRGRNQNGRNIRPEG